MSMRKMDRYKDQPFLRLLECYVLSAIEQLDEERSRNWKNSNHILHRCLVPLVHGKKSLVFRWIFHIHSPRRSGEFGKRIWPDCGCKAYLLIQRNSPEPLSTRIFLAMRPPEIPAINSALASRATGRLVS